MTSTLKGAAELKAKLQQMRTGGPGAIAAALLEFGQLVIGTALPLVPVRTGQLRDSAAVEIEEVGGKLLLRVGFGTDYALEVHERTDVSHPHGQAKFLQVALEARLGEFQAFMAKRVPELLAGGATAPVGVHTVGA